MIELTRQTILQLRHGALTKEDLQKQLLNYPMSEIVETCAALLMETGIQSTPTKITITQEQFDAHFRIAGLKEDGTKETRGRKPKQQEAPEFQL